MLKKEKMRLSKSILEMKFMKRTKDKIDKEIEEAEFTSSWSNEITEKMINSDSNYIIELSMANCESLKEGRFSFRGMNPDIERLLELEQAEKEAATRHVQQKEVTDVEMAKFYSSTRMTKAERKYSPHQSTFNVKRLKQKNFNKKFK